MFVHNSALYVGGAGFTRAVLKNVQTQVARLLPKLGRVPTTPDPNTLAKVSRYKWEAYRDTNWWCIYYFLARGGHTFEENLLRKKILSHPLSLTPFSSLRFLHHANVKSQPAPDVFLCKQAIAFLSEFTGPDG